VGESNLSRLLSLIGKMYLEMVVARGLFVQGFGVLYQDQWDNRCVALAGRR
jgi:hypothetical protein